MTTDVLTSASAGLGHITLNRPSRLHALTTSMCETMIQALLTWREDDNGRVVLIDHAEGTRGFCAGGDTRLLAQSGAGDGVAARAFFLAEYRLNHLLFSYPKPVIALMDGVTMGGGVGLASPASFRIATERTVYAMPEVKIGLFPDVGAGWYLPRKPGEIGMWLALTGSQLRAGDCLEAGIATHYLPAHALPAARAHMASAANEPDPREALQKVLFELNTENVPPIEKLVPDNRDRIDDLFAHDSIESIVAALEADGSDWALDQLATLSSASPLSLKVTFRQLRDGAQMASFADEMQQEYRLATRLVAGHDFAEGVRARLVDKDNAPIWEPRTGAAVGHEVLDAIFAPLAPEDEWAPLS